VVTTKFKGKDGQVQKLEGHEVTWIPTEDNTPGRMEPIKGTEFEMDADLILLAMGFTKPEQNGLLDYLGVAYNPRGNIQVNKQMMTSVPKVFAAGDVTTGAWLVVQAITAARHMARSVDQYLMD
jgi:glutamate synthase (NADPH/NADH) small chain